MAENHPVDMCCVIGSEPRAHMLGARFQGWLVNVFIVNRM